MNISPSTKSLKKQSAAARLPSGSRASQEAAPLPTSQQSDLSTNISKAATRFMHTHLKLRRAALQAKNRQTATTPVSTMSSTRTTLCPTLHHQIWASKDMALTINTNRKETKMLTLIVIFSAAAVVSAVSVGICLSFIETRTQTHCKTKI